VKSTVAVIKTKPETILEDIERLMEMACFRDALPINKPVIIKDNISWHFPFLSANTTPWQLEGTLRVLKKEGFQQIIAVHNNTVVTNPFKGVILNRHAAIYRKYNILEKYNFIHSDMRWVGYRPKRKMRVLMRIFPEGIKIPDFFISKSIVHLPTMKTHIYSTTTGAMKNAFGGLLHSKRHYAHSWIHETLVDLLAIQKEIHSGIFCVMDGTICGSGPGPRTMVPHEKDYI